PPPEGENQLPILGEGHNFANIKTLSQNWERVAPQRRVRAGLPVDRDAQEDEGHYNARGDGAVPDQRDPLGTSPLIDQAVEEPDDGKGRHRDHEEQELIHRRSISPFDDIYSASAAACRPAALVFPDSSASGF